MHPHFLQTFVEVRTRAAHFKRKHPLLADRLEIRRNNIHDTCRRRLLIMLHQAVRPDYIDLDRTVKHGRELICKALRQSQGIQIRTAGKRTVSDILNRIRNPQADKRIAVCEGIFIDGTKCLRQTDLLILTGCRKCIRSDVADGIRQYNAERSEAAGKGIHFNNPESFRNHDMPYRFKSAERISRNSADADGQKDCRQNMLRLICTQIQLLCAVRRDCSISLRNLKNMIADSQLFDLLCSQDIVILLHQLCNRGNPRSGKNLLFRPVQANLRTVKEQINSSSVRIICRKIHIGQTCAAGECIRFDFRQRIRKFQRHQARTIPERLRLNPADTLRNLKAFAAFCTAEGTVSDYGIIFQCIASLNRTGQRFADLMRKYLFIAVFTGMNRNKRNRTVKGLIGINFCFSYGHRVGLLIRYSMTGFRNRRIRRRFGYSSRLNGCLLHTAGLFCRRHRGLFRFFRSSFGFYCRFTHNRRALRVNSLRAGKCINPLLKLRQHAQLLLHFGECTCHILQFIDRTDLFGKCIDLFLYVRNRIHLFLQLRNDTDLLLNRGNRFNGFAGFIDGINLFLYSVNRRNLILNFGNRACHLPEIADGFHGRFQLGKFIDLLLNIADRIDCFLHIGDRIDLLLHLGKLRSNLRHISDCLNLVFQIREIPYLFFD